MKKVLLRALAVIVVVVVLIVCLSHPDVSFMDFDRTEPLPDVDDIEYVEYYFDSFDGYMLTILIDIDDYVEILELACQDNSYEYHGSTYEQDGSVSIDLHVYTETNDVWVSFARKYSEELGGYYTLNSDIFSTIYSMLKPYRTQAMEEYTANNAG